MQGLGAPVLLLPCCHDRAASSPLVLDLLFTFNIALAMVVVLASVYLARPLDFSVFPTVLLMATLLALNIASTRVVLLEDTPVAPPGKVIGPSENLLLGATTRLGSLFLSSWSLSILWW